MDTLADTRHTPIDQTRTSQPSPDPLALDAFIARMEGPVLRPGSEAYESVRRVWNGMIDRRPAVIARCQGAADVVAAVQFGREQGLRIAVRGGGHNVAGYGTCDDGLLIDLSLMKRVEVDPEARTVRAGGGCTWGDVDRATQVHGLAVPGGVVSETGIAGLTLGGGLGWLRGAYGLSSDNLVAAEVVTADGRLLTTDERNHADLFWGLRGGGGNFGVVTAFTYRLHAVGPEVDFTFVFHDGRGDRMQKALRFFRSYCASVPDEVAPLAVLGAIPPVEMFDPSIHGTPFVLFAALHPGPVGTGLEAMAPLRAYAEPLADFSGVMPYTQVQTIFDEDYPAHTMRYYWKSLHLNTMSDEAIERITDHAKRQPSPFSTTDLWHIGGAVRRFPDEASAFSGRQAGFVYNPEANWVDAADDEANIRWVRQSLEALHEYSDGGRYLNFPGLHEEGESIMKQTFGSKYDRLIALKRAYDPDNLFRLNQNIDPR